MTYSLVNAPFLIVVLAALLLALMRRRRPRAVGEQAPPSPVAALAVTLVVLLITTAVFDNVIIGLGIVDYDPAHTSGLAIGMAPVEDFAYAIAAAIGLPALWLLLPAKKVRA